MDDPLDGGTERFVHMWDYHLEQWTELPVSEVAQRFRAAVDVRDRKYRLVTYPRVFVGAAAVKALVTGAVAASRDDALRIGQILVAAGIIEHTCREHDFEDAHLFYRFIEDTDRGAVVRAGSRSVSWADFVTTYTKAAQGLARTFYPPVDIARLPPSVVHIARAFWPMDSHNVKLLDNVHPPRWIDPEYSGTYQLVVIGAGAGGIEAATHAAQFGAKVALIEANVLGGGSLVSGCVPSKALLATANLAHTMRNTANLQNNGIEIQGKIKIDFGKVMARVRKVRATVSRQDSAVRMTRRKGVDIFYGHAKFTSDRTLVVSGNLLEFKRAVVATGAYPSVPPIPGLRELYGKQDSAKEAGAGAQYKPRSVMTSDNIFNMTTQPRRLCILGTGVIAMELAQAMQRLGSSVTMFGRADGVLPNEDRDLVADVVRQMEDDGVRFRLHVSEYEGVHLSGEVSDEGYEEVHMRTVERNTTLMYRFDAILVATGRKPNVTGLNLEAASVDYDTKSGLRVNGLLQTTNTRIYAVGDCCNASKMTHAATSCAKLAVRNALFLGRDRAADLLIPYVAHTSPPLARVGPTVGELAEAGHDFETVAAPFSAVDRARCDDETVGALRVHVDTTSGAILGCTVLGTGAPVIVAEIALAMKSEVRMPDLAKVIFPYPTTASIIRDVALTAEAERAAVPAKKFRNARRQTFNNTPE